MRETAPVNPGGLLVSNPKRPVTHTVDDCIRNDGTVHIDHDLRFPVGEDIRQVEPALCVQTPQQI